MVSRISRSASSRIDCFDIRIYPDLTYLLAHDLSGKPRYTFPDHALGVRVI
jgi:hypothetical protein